MTFQETLNQFLILGAALCKHVPTNDLELSQQNIVKDEVLYNIEFATQMKFLFKNNFVFEGEQGCVPTVKGWKSIQPRIQTKVVKQMQPKSVEKMTNVEVLSTFVESGFALCHRLPSDKLMQKKARESYADVADVLTCVAESFNNVFAPVEPVSDEEYDGCTNYTVGETEVAVEA